MISARTFVYLSEVADGMVCQGLLGVISAYSGIVSNVKTISDVVTLYRTGAQTFEAGKTYLVYNCFNYVTEVDCFQVNSDGQTITWLEDRRWQTPLGCEVKMPNGSVYKVIKNVDSSKRDIFVAVSPIIGKIPLSIGSNSTIYVSGLENVEATLASTTTTWQAAVRFTDCKDSNFHVDLSRMGYSGGAAGSQCIFSFSEGGKPIQPLNFNSYGLATNPQTNGQNTDSLVNSAGTASNVPVTLFAENPKIDLVNGRWQAILYSRYESYVTSDSKMVRRDFDINFLGSIPMLVPVYAEEGEEPSAQATMMKARSLSVEPSVSEEDFNNAIKGKKGIFTIKDGKAYDLLTGEYVD